MQNVILEKTFAFSLNIIEFTENLEGMRKFNMANQLFRSGTSIGANAREAQNPHSRADFIAKLKISAKEAEETEYWLLLCERSKSYPNPENLIDDLIEIKKILTAIISTSRRK